MKIVCVYCASSSKAADVYKQSATDAGRILTENDYGIVYGGGSTGLMGALADSVIKHNGKITGILPDFMEELEWGHKGVDMISVMDMHQRKSRMLAMSNAVVALAGGCGTFEEILEAITWKRLGLYDGPAVIVNTNGYYDPMIEQLHRSVDENFMSEEHRDMWTEIKDINELPDALKTHTSLPDALSKAKVI